MLLPILLLSIKLKSRPLTNNLIILFLSVTLSPMLGSSVLWVRPEMVTLAVVFCDMSSHRFIISSATSRGDLSRGSFVPTCSMISLGYEQLG